MPIEDSNTHKTQRLHMVRDQLRSRDIQSEKVLKIMEQLPRHHFIPPEHQSQAYLDQPVTIGLGQTISQPYIVALMTEKLDLRPHHHVLEIGYGCGYQSAVLAQLADQVYSIEVIDELARFGRQNLAALGFTNVHYHTGDGRLGWPAPPDTEPRRFDRILIAAAAEDVPPALKDQLKDGGKMVVPLGDVANQTLWLYQKNGPNLSETFLCYCRFVRLISKT